MQQSEVENQLSTEKILVVDDEPDLAELVRFNLAREGFSVSVADSGEAALTLIRAQRPHLVLLDLMLPGMDGLSVCRLLKQESATRDIPVVFISAKGEEADIVAGLELGADDYVTKPFSPKVLTARVRSVLRRHRVGGAPEDATLVVEGITIIPGKREVSVAGELIELTNTEFKLLHLLLRRRGWVFTRSQIVDRVHGEDYPVTDRSVDVQIVGLRRKLGVAGSLIETVRGVGYRFSGE